MGKVNFSWDLENFGVLDSGQGKGRQKLQVQTKPKPDTKIISHICDQFSEFSKFDKKWMFKAQTKDYKTLIVVLNPFKNEVSNIHMVENCGSSQKLRKIAEKLRKKRKKHGPQFPPSS